MKKILFSFLLLPSVSFAWMGSGGSPDYSRDASNIYYCANSPASPVTTQAGVSITSPTLSLFNPPTNTKNLVILETSVQPGAIPAQFNDYFLAYNVTPSTGIRSGTGAAVNITLALVGKSTSTATTTSLATCIAQGILPATPVGFRYIGSISTTTASGFSDLTNGKVVLPPGGLISVQSTGATSTLAGFVWREEPQ